jgi:hypothetical protein
VGSVLARNGACVFLTGDDASRRRVETMSLVPHTGRQDPLPCGRVPLGLDMCCRSMAIAIPTSTGERRGLPANRYAESSWKLARVAGIKWSGWSVACASCGVLQARLAGGRLCAPVMLSNCNKCPCAHGNSTRNEYILRYSKCDLPLRQELRFLPQCRPIVLCPFHLSRDNVEGWGMPIAGSG